MIKKLLLTFTILIISCLLIKGQETHSDISKYASIVDYCTTKQKIKKNIRKFLDGRFYIFRRISFRKPFSRHKLTFKVDYAPVENFFSNTYFEKDTNNIEFKLNISINKLRALSTTEKAHYILLFAGEYKNTILVECIWYNDDWMERYRPDEWGLHYVLLFIFNDDKIIDVKKGVIQIM